MDIAGIQLGLMEIVGVLLLLGVLVWMVVRTNSKGRSASPERTEQATHDLYDKEERKHDDGTEGL